MVRIDHHSRAITEFCRLHILDTPRKWGGLYGFRRGEPGKLRFFYEPPRLEELSLDDPDAEAVITAALDGTQYHALCSEHPMRHYWALSVSTQLPIRSEPMIYRFNSQNETWFRITESLRYDHQNLVRYDLTELFHHPGEVLPNSWTRYFSFDTGYFPSLNFLVFFFSRHNASLTYQRQLVVRSIENQPQGSESWLAQANHIFTQLQETAHSEDYGTSLSSSILQYLMTHEPSLHNRNQFRTPTFAQCLQH
jgi:hypothetical protein